MLDTPVLFLIFNRLDTTKRVFEAIRRAQPKQLFIGADGPRPNKEGEAAKCEVVRAAVIAGIDWECEVQTLFREENLGTGPAVSGAITWFFSQVDKGIILEDDCLPDDSFFEYANDVLRRYEHDEQIMHVSGCNLQCGIKRGDASYYFSKIPAIWGWATWKRAWDKYSFDFFGDTDSKIISVLKRSIENEHDVEYYLKEFFYTKTKLINTWDYQWFYTLLRCEGISITPQFNLIENLGFNSSGTHTFSAPYWYRYIVNGSISTLSLPNKLTLNRKADRFYLDLTMGRRTIETLYVKIIYKIKLLIK